MAINNTNNKQTNLFSVEDWKKLYTTFSDSDFQSYDFESIRKVMVDYLRTYYAEDFNDFVESSEFIALIDLIAFQAQSLSFRTELNARENFLETAERQDSVLKLVKQLNYSPNRNKSASGLLKIQSINTSENVFDYGGTNLARRNIVWNDPGNPDWASQFSLVMNAALASGQRVGKPFASKNINGIKTEQYNLAVPNTVQTIFPFAVNLNNNTTQFEIVSASITNSETISESDPGAFGNHGIVYQNDGRGNSSANTGYFLYFKQGELKFVDLAYTSKTPNNVTNINVSNINDEDVWFYELNKGIIGDLWTKIINVSGNNAIYNSTARGIRTIYQVNTRMNDQIDLVFGDDTFANIPIGNYRAYFRVSNGLTYRVSPADMNNITITVPYIDKNGRSERLIISASLQYTVANSSRRDSIVEIKSKAPMNFYSQNRMVNGEDYNIFPYSFYSDIVKVKSVNRISSGISRYLDIIDPTGKYSSTDLFASDGSFYRDNTLTTVNFSFTNRNDILRVINDKVLSIIGSKSLLHYYYENFPQIDLTGLTWVRKTSDTTTSTGFFALVTDPTIYEQIGVYSNTTLRYLLINSLIEFVAPTGYYFDASNSLVFGSPSLTNDKTSIWATIKSQIGEGSNSIFIAGREIGGVTISDNIPSGALIRYVFPPFNSQFTPELIQTMTNYISNNIEFGLRYDYTQTVLGEPWQIIPIRNINRAYFDLTTAGTTADSSYLLLFTTDNIKYTLDYRGLDYVFASQSSILFLNTNPTKVYDSRTNTIVEDNIKVLQSNLNNTQTGKLSRDIVLKIYKNQVEPDGYIDSSKVQVTFPSGPNSDLPLDPTIFSTIVTNTTTSVTYVFFIKFIDYDNLIRFRLLNSSVVNYGFTTKVQIDNVRNNFPNGRLFYATTDKKFYQITSNGTANSLTDVSLNYTAYIGRQDIMFQYKHNASDKRRIDPAASNLIDCYIMPRNYDEAYRNYITDYTGKLAEPDAIDSVTLNTTYSELLNLKMVSDELILNPGIYKPLFGSKADSVLQGTFQTVKKATSNISDNELKSMVISAINEYFALDNWDFGSTFYFSELSGYLHSKLGNDLSSIVLIPSSTDSKFGDLYEIRSQPNEILISAATVENVQVVSGVYIGMK